jgi:hypothetical protein
VGRGVASGQSGNDTDLRPSPDDRCAECGDPVSGEWVSYRQDPGESGRLIEHFGGIVLTGPIAPRAERPKRKTRDIRDPRDLDVFFHPWCAPRVRLPEREQREIARLLADLLVTDYRKRAARWARVAEAAGIGARLSDAWPRLRAPRDAGSSPWLVRSGSG